MSRAQWRERLGPQAVIMGTAALLTIAAASLAADPPAPVAAAVNCGPAGPMLRSAAAAGPAAAFRARGRERLGTRGQFIGRALTVTPENGARFELSLPVESSVSLPVGKAVVYTRHNTGRSEVRAIDLVSGCDTLLAQPPGVVRSALLAADGKSVYVHAVAGAARADAGITRYPIGGGAGVLVMPQLPADARFGPTFGTRLEWSVDGSTLVVQSCGATSCRTRLLDVATGAIVTLDAHPHGELIGVTATHLVAFDACHWLPCGVLSIHRATTELATLADEAMAATLRTGPDGTSFVQIQTPAGTVEVAP